MDKDRVELEIMVNYDTRMCCSCFLGKKNKKCRNKSVWRRDSNKPYSSDNNMMVVCCFVAQNLNRGKNVNGWSYNKNNGLTTHAKPT